MEVNLAVVILLLIPLGIEQQVASVARLPVP